MKTLYINSPSTDIYFNLATEEYLLKNHAENIFMLWQNDASVVLGKHQDARAEIDLDFTKEKQIRVARRYSGGGTVYHDLGNINLTFIENTDTADFDKYAGQTLHFLSTIGIEAQTDERRGIHINQSKISGSAQCIYKRRIMYHCTLLYHTDLTALVSSLDAKPEQTARDCRFSVKSVKSKVTNIHDHLQNPPTLENFKEQTFAFFSRMTPQRQVYNLTKEDLSGIEQLRNEKYARESWIFNRIF